jgi:hypothetical protein
VFYPIQTFIYLNAPVKCARPECPNAIMDQRNAVFVVRHVMTIAYCCPECYLETWRQQMIQDRNQRPANILTALGYDDSQDLVDD